MDRAQVLFPNLSLDPKRIAATSVAIALHVVVLMLLMLPAQTAPTKAAIVDTPMVMTPTYIPPIPLTPPPPSHPHPIATAPHPTTVAPISDPVDNTSSPVDPYVPPQDDIVAEHFDPPAQESAFAQISADISPPPPYPTFALKHGITGVVTLRVRVDALGRPVEVIVDHGSGSKLLDEAAMKFVRARWHFIPAMQNGAAIEAYALVPINFVIER